MQRLPESPFKKDTPTALATHSSPLFSHASFRHLHNISRNLHFADGVSSFFASIYENIILPPVYGIGYDFQFLSIELDLIFLCVPVMLYRLAEFFRVSH